MESTIKQKQLKLLLNDFELLSETVLLQLQIVTKLMQDNKSESLYADAETNELIIDRLEMKIREEVVYSIFQFTPKATDLRQIIAYQEVTTNLERVGDMLLNVVHRIKNTNFEHPAFKEIRHLTNKLLLCVSEMLNSAIFSFSNEESPIAYQIIKKDDEADELFHRIKEMLQENFAGIKLSKDDIKSIVNANTIAHNLERIGDSATNIAEATIYLIEGEDVRHKN
jgi:phosphate transport system protein